MDDHSLPVAYGKTRLVLLPVDPYMIHAYWEVTPNELREANKQARRTQAILRFYRESEAAGEDAPADSFDVKVAFQSRNWYVHLWSPEKTLHADLMLKRNDGTLVPLVRSQIVHLPRIQPELSIEQTFMKVEPARRVAEIVPPPPRPAAKPIDAAKIVRETLTKVYASRQFRSESAETEAPLSSLPRGEGGPKGRERAAALPHMPPVRTAADLTAIAERTLVAGISSGMLEKSRVGGRSDSKK